MHALQHPGAPPALTWDKPVAVSDPMSRADPTFRAPAQAVPSAGRPPFLWPPMETLLPPGAMWALTAVPLSCPSISWAVSAFPAVARMHRHLPEMLTPCPWGQHVPAVGNAEPATPPRGVQSICTAVGRATLRAAPGGGLGECALPLQIGGCLVTCSEDTWGSVLHWRVIFALVPLCPPCGQVITPLLS